ncbi:HTH domain-containing protein [Carnobacterium sp.]|uniref:HTH domain-containing protein n=1 Tax=Carnobacterium sp. TaxID=48221 RepID=UPI002FCC0BA5
MNEELLKKLNYEYKLSNETISHILDISVDELDSSVEFENKKVIDEEKKNKLDYVLLMLAEGIGPIESNIRVQAVVNELIVRYKISLESLALLTGVTQEDIELMLNGSKRIKEETKFDFSVKIMMIYAVVRREFAQVDMDEIPEDFFE